MEIGLDGLGRSRNDRGGIILLRGGQGCPCWQYIEVQPRTHTACQRVSHVRQSSIHHHTWLPGKQDVDLGPRGPVSHRDWRVPSEGEGGVALPLARGRYKGCLATKRGGEKRDTQGGGSPSGT